MARGVKYPEELKERAIAAIAAETNLGKISKDLGIPYNTLRTWKAAAVLENQEVNFVKLRAEKKEEFINKAWESITLAQDLALDRLKRAYRYESEIDTLLYEIKRDDDIHPLTKQSLISKLETLKINTIKSLSTFIGTMYDKQALAAGDPTEIAHNKETGKDVSEMTDQELKNEIKTLTEELSGYLDQ